MLRRTVARGTSNDEFSLFLLICRKHKVDPFIGQIHCVMFPVTKHHKDEKGIWVSGEQMVIIMGINGYRSLAARHHKDYGGCDEPIFEMSQAKTPTGKQIPDSCTIRLWKKGLEHPVVAKVFWEEFAPKDLTSSRADFWNRMPKHKLAIVAESHAIRKGYPDLADIYTEEEMEQKLQDFSDGGRQIVDGNGHAPSGRPVTYDARTGSHEAAQAVAEAKNAGLWCPKHSCHVEKCPSDEHTTAENDEICRKLDAAKNSGQERSQGAAPVNGGRTPDPAPSTPSRVVTVRWTPDKRFASIQADNPVITFLLNDIKTWKGEWLDVEKVYAIPAEYVPSLEERCSIAGFGFQEILGPPATPPKTGQPGTAAPTSGASGSTPDAPTAGKIIAIKPKPKDKNFRMVNFNGDWMSCWDPDMWVYLEAGLGMNASLYIKTNKGYKNIVGIARIGSRTFSDGKIPDIQIGEERRKPSELVR